MDGPQHYCFKRKLTKSIIMDLNLWPVLSILVYVYKYLNGSHDYVAGYFEPEIS